MICTEQTVWFLPTCAPRILHQSMKRANHDGLHGVKDPRDLEMEPATPQGTDQVNEFDLI
jgi:hypothetical protein